MTRWGIVPLLVWCLAGPALAVPQSPPRPEPDVLVRSLAATDATPEDRFAAATELVRLVDDRTIGEPVRQRAEACVREVLTSKPGPPRITLCRALGRQVAAAKRFHRDLVTLLLDPAATFDAMREAAGALRAQDDPETGKAVMAAATDRAADKPRRLRAVEAAGALDEWAAIEGLVGLTEDSTNDVRAAAAASLARLTMVQLAPDETWKTWWAANRTRKPLDVVREQMRGLLERERAQLKRFEEELAKLLAPSDPKANLEALKSSFAEVRLSAARNLAKLRDRAALDPLVRAVGGEAEPRVRAMLIEALGGTLGPADAAAIQVCVDRLAPATEPEAAVRAAAAAALGTAAPDAGVRALETALASDPDTDVREKAADALAKFRGRVGLAVLRTVLDPEKDVPDRVRSAAVRAVSELGAAPSGDPGAVALLVPAALAGKSAAVRWNAVYGLGRVVSADDTAVRALDRVLEKETDTKVRATAVAALAKRTRDDEVNVACAALARLIADADPAVAESARKGLKEQVAANVGRMVEIAERLPKTAAAFAADLLEEGLARIPQNGEAGPLRATRRAASDRLATLCEELGAWPRAVAALEALARDGRTPERVRRLARALRMAGKPEPAARTLRDAASEFPEVQADLLAEAVDVLDGWRREGAGAAAADALDALFAGLPFPPGREEARARCVAARDAARGLTAAAGGDAVARDALAETVRAADGARLTGLVEQCLAALGAPGAEALAADAVLRAVPERIPAPDGVAPLHADASAETCRRAQDAWRQRWEPRR